MAVSFDEVAVYFSEEEWACLEEWQRRLYNEVMKDNVELVTSVGLLLQALRFSKMGPEETPQLIKRENLPRKVHHGKTYGDIDGKVWGEGVDKRQLGVEDRQGEA
ncbi:zinc finger protein 879-like [Rana temporaria]|uniref:zinc finger protein 879-like n=1 Tax=Rana temporaria TaxID=8407 RepID=UPI001AACC5EA|nr:zinc finger protein 879-like [Rana temporaria]